MEIGRKVQMLEIWDLSGLITWGYRSPAAFAIRE
jgi:hypothetical protein